MDLMQRLLKSLKSQPTQEYGGGHLKEQGHVPLSHVAGRSGSPLSANIKRISGKRCTNNYCKIKLFDVALKHKSMSERKMVEVP